jgi:hypothetical protein
MNQKSLMTFRTASAGPTRQSLPLKVPEKRSSMRWWAGRPVLAVAVTLAALAIQNSASAGKPPFYIPFFDGGSLSSGGFSASVQALQAQLQALPQFQGYTVTIVQYDSSGNLLNANGFPTGRTIEGDLADNPNLLNYTVCFSAGCAEVQYLLNTQDPTIYQLVAMDPYNNGDVPGPIWPLTMHLDNWTTVQLVVSDGEFGALPGPSDYQDAWPYPVGGWLISVTPAPTSHESLLDWAMKYSNTGLQDFTEAEESGIWPSTPGDPTGGSPSAPGSPASGVPAAGGGGEESHVLTGVGTAAFRARSNDRYFHARPGK